jgi:hypothetical protein
VLSLKQTAGLFVPGSVLVGATSNAQFTLVSYNALVDVNSGIVDNQGIEGEAANGYLNFAETNIFGDPPN